LNSNGFNVQQTLGAVYELLLISSPMTDLRTEDILRRIESIPATLRFGQANLTEPVQPFAKLAISDFGDARARLYTVVSGLQPLIKPQYHQALAAGDSIVRAAQYAQSPGRTNSLRGSFRIRPRFCTFRRTTG
jgi:hypothetical protein